MLGVSNARVYMTTNGCYLLDVARMSGYADTLAALAIRHIWTGVGSGME